MIDESAFVCQMQSFSKLPKPSSRRNSNKESYNIPTQYIYIYTYISNYLYIHIYKTSPKTNPPPPSLINHIPIPKTNPQSLSQQLSTFSKRARSFRNPCSNPRNEFSESPPECFVPDSDSPSEHEQR